MSGIWVFTGGCVGELKCCWGLTAWGKKLPCIQHILLYFLPDKQQGEHTQAGLDDVLNCSAGSVHASHLPNAGQWYKYDAPGAFHHPPQISGLVFVVPGCRVASQDTLNYLPLQVRENMEHRVHCLYFTIFCGSVSKLSVMLVGKFQSPIIQGITQAKTVELVKQHSDIGVIIFKMWELSGDDILWLHQM